MARVGRFLGWGACLLAAAVFAAYAFGPIDALPGMRLGGTPTDAPANWIDVNDHDDIFIETAGFPPLVLRHGRRLVRLQLSRIELAMPDQGDA